jgi:Leucine-rich repeat (LRR) protein
LKWLFVGKNQLSALPAEIGCLRELTQLDLGGNRLRNLPPKIAALGKLEFLLLDCNELELVPTCLSDLPRLSSLHFENNRIESLPRWLGRLKYLSVKGNPLPPEILQLAGGAGKKLLKYLREEQRAGPVEVLAVGDVPPLDRGALKKYRRRRYFDMDCGYEDVMKAAKPVFHRLLKSLIDLPENASELQRRELLHTCIEELNEVNDDENLENGIDTDEREYFCSLIEEIAGLAGLENVDDIIAQRDW